MSAEWLDAQTAEGKLVVIASIVALVWCGLGLLRRQWLATGLLVASSVTMSEPESPPALKLPSLIPIWLTNRATPWRCAES